MSASNLPVRPLGKEGLHAAAQGLGCMSLSKGMYHDESQLPPEEDRIALIHKAFSSGVTLLSTADLYGPYDNHVLIGKQLAYAPKQFRRKCTRHLCVRICKCHRSIPNHHHHCRCVIVFLQQDQQSSFTVALWQARLSRPTQEKRSSLPQSLVQWRKRATLCRTPALRMSGSLWKVPCSALVSTTLTYTSCEAGIRRLPLRIQSRLWQ